MTYIKQSLQTARSLINARQLNKAKELLDQLLEVEQDNLEALDLNGFVHYFLNDAASAKQFCLRALTIKPNHAYAQKGLALSEAKLGNVNEAKSLFETVIKKNPTDDDARRDYAVMLFQGGFIDEAQTVIDEAIEAIPNKRKLFLELKQNLS